MEHFEVTASTARKYHDFMKKIAGKLHFKSNIMVKAKISRGILANLIRKGWVEQINRGTCRYRWIGPMPTIAMAKTLRSEMAAKCMSYHKSGKKPVATTNKAQSNHKVMTEASAIAFLKGMGYDIIKHFGG